MYTIAEVADQHRKKLEEQRNGMDAKTFESMVELMVSYMTPGQCTLNKLPMKEALGATDASILFQRVISDKLAKPIEGNYIGQSMLTKKVQIEGVRSIEFPSIGALRAFDLQDGQAPREQTLSFTEHRTEIKVGKVGVACALSEDVINDSQWELVGLHLEAMQAAMNRHKEQKIFNEFLAWGHTVFDNTLPNNAAGLTNGKASDGNTRNGSVAFDDFVDTLAALVAHEYNPTDIIMHPLAWVIFAKNPILRNLMFTQSTIGQSVWKGIGPDSLQTNIPWNINVQITPFQTYEQNVAKTIYTTATGSSSVTDDYTAITVIDRSNAMLLLTRDEPSTDQWTDPLRDILMLKIKERYGLGVLNEGRSVACIKNVRVAQDYSPIYNVGSVTVT